MKKRFCDNCDKEIDTSLGYFKLQREYTERDFGLPLAFKILDLCCRKCLIEYAKSEKCIDRKIK